MIYYQLRCITCSETFKPVLATERGELLAPDYEQMEESHMTYNADQLRGFHAKHAGHELQELPYRSKG